MTTFFDWARSEADLDVAGDWHIHIPLSQSLPRRALTHVRDGLKDRVDSPIRCELHTPAGDLVSFVDLWTDSVGILSFPAESIVTALREAAELAQQKIDADQHVEVTQARPLLEQLRRTVDY